MNFKIIKKGDHVTLVSFSKALRNSIKAAEKLKAEGINVEVINLRTLRPLDRGTIV